MKLNTCVWKHWTWSLFQGFIICISYCPLLAAPSKLTGWYRWSCGEFFGKHWQHCWTPLLSISFISTIIEITNSPHLVCTSLFKELNHLMAPKTPKQNQHQETKLHWPSMGGWSQSSKVGVGLNMQSMKRMSSWLCPSSPSGLTHIAQLQIGSWRHLHLVCEWLPLLTSRWWFRLSSLAPVPGCEWMGARDQHLECLPCCKAANGSVYFVVFGTLSATLCGQTFKLAGPQWDLQCNRERNVNEEKMQPH